MGFRNFFQRFSAVAWFATLLAQKIMDEIPRDAADPGAQFFRFAQIAELLPRRQKSFLRQILALAQITGGAKRQRADQRLVTRDDLPEGVGRATTRSVVLSICWIIVTDMVFSFFLNR